MPRRPPAVKQLSTAAHWPVGILLTSWRYMWRTTPVHRFEKDGSSSADGPPALPAGADREELQPPSDGAGPLLHRIYRTRIAGARITAQELMKRIMADLDEVAPTEFASFQKVEGDEGGMAVGDEHVVRMPGPWDGPVRVVAAEQDTFRLATLEGHLEAGQIEFRVSPDRDGLEFSIESWARSGDRLSDLLYSHVRISKEVQLHMWTSTLEKVVKLAGGQMRGGITVITRRVDPDVDEPDDEAGGTGPGHGRAQRRLAALADRGPNFDPDSAPGPGWHVDDMRETLPRELPGPPEEGGSWQAARNLMRTYQVADPEVVRSTYRHNAPLEGRDMLLEVRFAGLRFHVGVRVGEVYEEDREVDGREGRVFGWYYRTLEGNFEQGQQHYEVWKWTDTGEVEFRTHAYSRVADSGPLILRLGFRLVGRRNQLDFYRAACRRMGQLSRAQLAVQRRPTPGRREAAGSR
jgi:uncharacterized protein (UPF0548 family)